jgi:hypothetical protein
MGEMSQWLKRWGPTIGRGEEFVFQREMLRYEQGRARDGQGGGYWQARHGTAAAEIGEGGEVILVTIHDDDDAFFGNQFFVGAAGANDLIEVLSEAAAALKRRDGGYEG